MTTRTEGYPIDARELALFAVNDGGLYQRRALPIIANLARKIVAETYSVELAGKAWLYLADDAAKEYVRQFGPMTPFNKATRQLAAAQIAGHYADQIRDTAADLKAERDNRKRWTLSAVKAANEAAGHFFFSRDTMRFFGDTMASFKVVCEGRDVCLERVKADKEGHGLGKRYTFHPETGHINAHERA